MSPDQPLFVFARFHAREGDADDIETALRAVVAPTREEDGCLFIEAYRSTRDPRLFYVHSRWKNEAAFDLHGELPHTVRFLEQVRLFIDHPLDVIRTRSLDDPPEHGRTS